MMKYLVKRTLGGGGDEVSVSTPPMSIKRKLSDESEIEEVVIGLKKRRQVSADEERSETECRGMNSTHLASSGGGVPGTHSIVFDWARQARLSVASKGPEKELVETGETSEPGDRDRVECDDVKAPSRRGESQECVMCR